MNPSSFEFIPECDRDSFIERDPFSGIQTTEPPPVETQSTIDEIVLSSNVNNGQDEVEQSHNTEVRPKRVYVGTSIRQRTVLATEFAEHGISKPIQFYQDKTRLCPRAIKRLIKDMQSGKDITRPGKRGRKPKFTPQLLQKIASELCTTSNSLRETQKAIITANIEAVGRNDERLPEVSFSTIGRYVHNAEIMNDVDIGPLSFTQVTNRGPAANSESNKLLRIKRREELGDFINAGYTVVFVDESHWNVGNVKTRGWGPRDRNTSGRSDLHPSR